VQIFINTNKLKMKKLVLILGSMLLSITGIKAQQQTQACDDNGSGTGSVNGTHTDPTIGLSIAQGGATPANSTYQQNTFDWRAPSWPFYYFSTFGGGQIINPTLNPFSSTDNYLRYQVAKDLTHSDFQPKDGWELVKQDFGFYYGSNNYNGFGNNIWDGGGNTHNPGYPSATQQFSDSYDGMAYFILYNKYSGTLRVFVTIPLVNSGEDKIYVHLAFTDNNGDKPSGLFNHYNNPETTGALSLDQKTIVGDIGAVAAYPYPGSDKFFFADFQMAYDPCVCIFQSGIHVYFEHINTANVQLTGRFAGVAQDIANVSNGTGTSYGDGRPGTGPTTSVPENFVASIFADPNGNPQSVMQSYAGISNASADAQLAQVGTGIEAIGQFASAFIKGSQAAESEGTDISADYTAYSDAIGGVAKTVEFFSYSGSSEATVGNAHALILSGYENLSGTISTTIMDNGYDAYIAVPGSPETTDGVQPTEYTFNDNGDAIPSYPMYNEPLGLFALLKKPAVYEYRHYPDINNYGEVCYLPPPTSDQYAYDCQFFYGDQPTPQYNPYNNQTGQFMSVNQPPTRDYFTFEYNPTEDLVYALSPLVDQTKSKIFVGYEIDGMPVNFSGQTYDGTFISNTLKGFADVLTNTDYGNDATYHEQVFNRNRTNFFPISCNTSIFTEEKFGFYVNNRTGDDFTGNWVLGQGQVAATNSNFYDNQDVVRAKSTRKVKLVVLLALVSKPDVYGLTHLTFQSIKYNCDVINKTTEFSSSNPNYQAIANAPTDIVVGQGGISFSPPSNTVFSKGHITVEGNLNTAAGPSGGLAGSPEYYKDFVAQTEIIFSPTSSNTDEIYVANELGFYTSDIPPSITAQCSTQIAPLAIANITSYCKSNYNGLTYKANQNAKATASASNNKGGPSQSPKNADMTITKLGTVANIKLGIFPNPTTGLVYLNLSAQNAGGLLVNVSDLNGNQVLHNTFSANEGANSFKVDLGSLNQGVYFINITDVDDVPIKNDKIVLLPQ
jgi:hypothetical protein